MIWLLDVNVLIALIDPSHIAHDRVHDWFAAEGHTRWATCPLTENGVIRITGNPKYPNTPGSPAAAANLVRSLRALPGHVFWPDDISLADPEYVDASQVLTSAQVTDSYLLALAKAHGGKLATLDRRLVTSAVKGGKQALHLID